MHSSSHSNLSDRTGFERQESNTAPEDVPVNEVGELTGLGPPASPGRSCVQCLLFILFQSSRQRPFFHACPVKLGFYNIVFSFCHSNQFPSIFLGFSSTFSCVIYCIRRFPDIFSYFLRAFIFTLYARTVRESKNWVTGGKPYL